VANEKRSLARAITPGVMLAALGVGAGDLATAGVAGTRFGVSLAWAVIFGAGLKFVLTEGLMRWQLATGTTLIEGATRRLGGPFRLVFLAYLLPWSFLASGALVNASGTLADAVLPFAADDPRVGRVVYGLAHSVVIVVLVLAGGFRLFQRVLMALVGVMLAGVLVTALYSRPDLGALGAGLLIPRVPGSEGGLAWTAALLGGVGGTVSILCYGYWIREHGREGAGFLRLCRIDLGVCYVVTALLGVAMLVIASRTPVSGSGSGLLISLGDSLGRTFGPLGRSVFLVGVWAAIVSSLLGGWQAVPYLFADAVQNRGGGVDDPSRPVSRRSWTYRGFVVSLAVVPIPMLFIDFQAALRLYAVFGALFIPFLAALLLIMNGRASWVGRAHRNGFWSMAGLVAAMVLFGWLASIEIVTWF
jgi:Mn2+/Fe2+ NRAMP family transporter